MTPPNAPIRNISDTALWVAIYRARESERPDAVFKDPLARRLAGERGEQIAASMKFAEKNEWSFTARTYIGDQLITEQVARGCDMVINLAAGLDTRPYRLALPATLRWIEVDLPPLLAYKEEKLEGERPVCRLERVALDLSDRPARRQLFARLGKEARRVLVMSEGLIIYLTADEVGALATDLAAQPAFERWITDLTTPPLFRMLQRRMGGPLEQAGSPLKFSPDSGAAFFAPFGWKPIEAHSYAHIAGRLGRAPWLLRLMTRLFPSEDPNPKRIWGGMLLLGRI